MKNILLAIALALATTGTVTYSLAQEPVAVVSAAPEQPAQQPEVSDADFIKAAADAVIKIHESVKQEGVAKVTIMLSIILLIAQLLIQLTKTALFGRIFSKADDSLKLLIVSVCTVLTTAVPMLLSGVGVIPTLMSGAVLSAVMVAGHQVYKKFFEKSA